MVKLICCLKNKPDAYLLKDIYDEAINYSADISIMVDKKTVSAKNLPALLDSDNDWANQIIIYADGVDENLAMYNINRKMQKLYIYS